MFYGGALLSHLSYDCDPPENEAGLSDFIRLARLNRNACVVIDSDRKGADGNLNATKRRVQQEFENEQCFVWITEGRMIENYVPEFLLDEAVARVHPLTAKKVVWKQFGDLTKLGPKKTFDKVAVARGVAGKPADFSKLDLEKKMNRLVECIRLRNCV